MFPSAILSRRTAADFVLIFHQRGIEEAQFGLQRRDDVIDQVGTKLAWLGSEVEKSRIGLCFHINTLTDFAFYCFNLFLHVFETEKPAVEACRGNNRGVFQPRKGEAQTMLDVCNISYKKCKFEDVIYHIKQTSAAGSQADKSGAETAFGGETG